MNELDEFINLNNLDRNELMNALHLEIREILLKVICKKMKNDPSFFMKAKNYYFTYADEEAANKILYIACKCKLPSNDLKWLNECIKAAMSKRDKRNPITLSVKSDLIRKQDGKCRICKCPISMNDMHVDHIIPWDYVGDELSDNFQGLCSECNLSKSNHVAEAVQNIILHMEEV